MIKKDDFVIIKKNYSNIELNSVGIVDEVLSNNIFSVFFIGKRVIVKLPESDIQFLDINKTGKPYKFKICNVCHILKEDYIDFEVNQTDAKGRKTTRPTCRECRKEIDGVKLKPEEKRRLEKSRPNQFFVCPVCGKASIPGVTANLVKDHDHNTGNAREWICDSCNTGLGRFKDDISLLEKAIKYIRKHLKK